MTWAAAGPHFLICEVQRMGERLEVGGGLRSLWDEVQGWGREAPRRWTRTARPRAADAHPPPAVHGRRTSMLSPGGAGAWAAGPRVPSRFCGALLLGQTSFSQDPISSRLRKNRFETFTVALTLAFRATLRLWEGSGADLEPQQSQGRKNTFGERFGELWGLGVMLSVR